MKKFIVLCWFFVLSGCSSSADVSDLQQFVDDTLAKPRGRIEPIPVFKPYESFNYSSAGVRSPFELPVIVDETVQIEKDASNIRPDDNRPKEHLEQFDFNELVMVGTLKGGTGALWVLVRDGDGGVVRIKEGNYLGQNHGRVVSVSDYRISLVEIVPNGMGGWIERPRTMVLEGLSGE
ncbi:pilus assembly protein PilP [Bacterioplanes sanyensis]|uniref:Pilus assembly protein PilP n=1 Tax=Bacterioplanes sanyensis TaxID=1249553 RepID=A0A222FEE4_9GAMM|nr:pilus assembly protein PilP [Bacterioplanes sanyensis]ASP37467.1 pilus assembly protein PilP [Bacterioplanes sanyensis]